MPSEPLDPQTAYYYNTETSQVEQGYQSAWTGRMGPYRTREEAEKALETAARRNRDWEQAEREWEGEGED